MILSPAAAVAVTVVPAAVGAASLAVVTSLSAAVTLVAVVSFVIAVSLPVGASLEPAKAECFWSVAVLARFDLLRRDALLPCTTLALT